MVPFYIDWEYSGAALILMIVGGRIMPIDPYLAIITMIAAGWMAYRSVEPISDEE